MYEKEIQKTSSLGNRQKFEGGQGPRGKYPLSLAAGCRCGKKRKEGHQG